MDEPSPYQFSNADDEENPFPDVACLGIDTGCGSENITLLPMPADPSSAEQFSAAFGQLGRDASIDIDLPDCLEALRGLFLDRSSKLSRAYDTAVTAICRLCEQANLRSRSSQTGREWTVDDCKIYVRRFAQKQNVAVAGGFGEWGHMPSGWRSRSLEKGDVASGVMLSEKTAYSFAVESFRALMDSTELIGFAEICIVEVLAEAVVHAYAKAQVFETGKVGAFRCSDAPLSNKPIPVPA